MPILNLSSRRLTRDELDKGGVEPYEEDQRLIRSICRFHYPPSVSKIIEICVELGSIAKKYEINNITIDINPFFLSYAQQVFKCLGFTIYFPSMERINDREVFVTYYKSPIFEIERVINIEQLLNEYLSLKRAVEKVSKRNTY